MEKIRLFATGAVLAIVTALWLPFYLVGVVLVSAFTLIVSTVITISCATAGLSVVAVPHRASVLLGCKTQRDREEILTAIFVTWKEATGHVMHAMLRILSLPVEIWQERFPQVHRDLWTKR